MRISLYSFFTHTLGPYLWFLDKEIIYGSIIGVIAVVQNIQLGICSRPPNRGQNGSHGVNIWIEFVNMVY